MATFEYDKDEYRVELSNCVLHMGGEFQGNLDFEISLDREIDIDVLKRHLRLTDEHGRDFLLNLLGFAGGGDRFDITTSWPTEPAPTDIQFLWNDASTPLGSLPVRQVRPEDYDDSARFENASKGGCLSLILVGVGLGLAMWFGASNRI